MLLIEQFTHVALALAETAYVLEGGRIRYHGTAKRLKDEPELLRSAYLLRDTDPGGVAGTESEVAVTLGVRLVPESSLTPNTGRKAQSSPGRP